MLAKFKYDGRPVHMFEIHGVRCFVSRMGFFAAGQFEGRRNLFVAAPVGMSYQQAAQKAAQEAFK